MDVEVDGNKMGPKIDNTLIAAVVSMSSTKRAGTLSGLKPEVYSILIPPGKSVVPVDLSAWNCVPEKADSKNPDRDVPKAGTSWTTPS